MDKAKRNGNDRQDVGKPGRSFGCRGAWRVGTISARVLCQGHPIAILAYLLLSGGAVTVGCNPSIRAVVHLSSFSFLSLSAPSSTAIRARSAAPVVIE